ncbi:MAG: hypothetical protein ACRENP_22450 [Longimicrobiales bacterium]
MDADRRVIAIRQALDITTGQAIITAILGWLVIVLPFLILAGLIVGLVAAR